MTNMWIGFLWAGAGGFLGAGLRYLVCGWIALSVSKENYMLGTFLVNMLGCLAIGVLTPFWLSAQHPMRTFVLVGLLGGFTTFSSFSSDTLYLIHNGRWAWALVYAAGSVCVGLLAAWAGMMLHGWLWK